MNQLVPIRGARTPSTTRHGRRGLAVPAAIAGAGDNAVRRFLEFFAATIRNKNTRIAYYRAVTDFFAWLDAAGIGTLVDIEPLHVATYIEALQERMAKPTVKQHLAAIRNRHHGLSGSGRDARKRAGHGRPRKPAHHQAL
jgi:site-specific recombinase XerD